MKPAISCSLLLVAGLLLSACNNDANDDNQAPVEVKVIAFNDFHGNLKTPSGGVRMPDPADAGKTVTVPAGGAEFLATWVASLKAKNPNNVVVSAGDLIGASPLLSALFHDEPTIESMNLLGLDINAVGNHEFDEGKEELLRMQNGGCHPVDGCQAGQFGGAKFRFLAANVVESASGKTLFPAYEIKRFNGIPVAFIGMTLVGTPSIVTPAGIAGLTFKSEAETVNALVPELQKQGVEAIAVVVHEGGLQTGFYNECKGISGPLVDIVNQLDKAVDLVITGHTHQAYNCNINGKLVTSAGQYGTLLSEIDLKLSPASRDVIEARAANLIVKTDVARDAKQTSLIDKFVALVSPLENRVIGTASALLSRSNNTAGESALGDIIADSQLAATADAKFGGAQIAFMNPGGIRADITPAANGNVTYGQLFTVQPFGNSLVTLTLKGSEIKTLLEQQWQGQSSPRILQVSSGFSYQWDNNRAVGDRVVPGSIRLNGVAVDAAANYRVTVNSFLASGGDNFLVLNNGTNRLGGAQDLDALEAWFKAHAPVAPGAQNRIQRLN